MDLSNILVIAGKPDLSELVSQTKGGAVVKNLVTGQKYPVFKNDRISSLGEIRIFTDSDEPKKAEGKELFDLLEKALPDYDRERVHTSDAKKLFAWYNVLLAAGKITFDEEAKEEK